MAVAKKARKAATPARQTAAPAPRAPRPAAKPAPSPAQLAVAAAPTGAKADKVDKAKKPKLVRDSFTIPKSEYVVLQELKQRAAKAGAPAKKSELLRAGLKALASMQDPALIAALRSVPALKTGRPAKS